MRILLSLFAVLALASQADAGCFQRVWGVQKASAVPVTLASQVTPVAASSATGACTTCQPQPITFTADTVGQALQVTQQQCGVSSGGCGVSSQGCGSGGCGGGRRFLRRR